MKTVRQSNFEVMRLMCMLFIVIYHVFIHVVIPTAGNERIYAALITLFHIGVLDFVMLSGYFGIRRSWKSFSKLYGITAFYTFMGVAVKVTMGGANLRINDGLSVLFPFSDGIYWFMATYFVLFLLAPYIEDVLKKQDNKGFLILITILFYVIIFYGFIFQKELGGGRSIIAFILMYTIGRFIRKNEHTLLNIKNRGLIYISASFVLFLLISFLPAPYTNYIKGVTFAYNSPGLYIFAVLFFMAFLGWNLKSRFVNYIAASTLPIYLIHENGNVRAVLVPYISPVFENGSILNTTLVALGLSVFIFVSCVIIDQVRIVLLLMVNNITKRVFRNYKTNNQ